MWSLVLTRFVSQIVKLQPLHAKLRDLKEEVDVLVTLESKGTESKLAPVGPANIVRLEPEKIDIPQDPPDTLLKFHTFLRYKLPMFENPA